MFLVSFELKSFNKNIVISQWFEDHLADTGPDYLANRKKLLKYNDYIKSNFITTHPSALNFLKSKKNWTQFEMLQIVYLWSIKNSYNPLKGKYEFWIILVNSVLRDVFVGTLEPV